MIGIYQITNKENGRSYIGQSTNIMKRFRNHFFKSSEKTHSSLFRIDIETYGKDAFELHILCECPREKLTELERKYINDLHPEYNEIVYGGRRSEQFCEAVSKGTKKWWNNLDQEMKDKIISNNLKGPKVGHKVSEHTRELLRKANLGKKLHRKVVIVETGQVFDSAQDCADYLGVTHGAVCRNIRGETNKTKGYQIEYLSSVETNGDECSHVGQKDE